MNASVVVITNNKGGVGKSTTADALADGLTLKGYKTLLIDLDPQCSLSSGIPYAAGMPTIYEVLTKQSTAIEAIQQRDDRADILPASKHLSRLISELVDMGKEYRLKEVLTPILPCFDYIIIDTPPALSILTVNAMTAAHSIIIPVQADIFSLQGVGQLIESVDAIRTYTNPGLKLMGVLLTRHNSRSILTRTMADRAEKAAESIGTFLYKSIIREAIAVKEAQASNQSLYEYAPDCNPAVDYVNFTSEFLERSENHA